jgi:hypothetical protein
MATTTPNYGWPVPTSTDYVKDGATAIEALGDAIDATVFGLPTGALTLLNTTSFTTSSGVAVDNVFTATYRNYIFTINLTAATATTDILFYGRTGGSDVTTNYNYQFISGRTTTVAANSGSTARLGEAVSGGALTTQFQTFLASPQLAQPTGFQNISYAEQPSGVPTQFVTVGRHTGTNQFDGIKIYPSAGTLTGTLSIYGLAK